MTIIYDIYETQPIANYSGSNQSKLFLPKTKISDIGALKRDVIGDTSTRYIDQNKIIGKMYLMSDFPKITATPAEFTWFSNLGFSRNLSIACPEEQYYDSVLAHPINYSATNGVSSALVNPQGFGFADSRCHDNLGMAFLYPTSSIVLFLGSAGTLVRRNDGPEEQFCDNTWAYAGPFQSKYKALKRLKTPTFYTPFVGDSLVSWSLNLGNSTRRNTSDVTNSYNAICYLCYTTVSAPSNEVPNNFSMVIDGPFAGTAGNLVTTFSNNSNPQFVTSYMSVNNLYFGYFGFGDDAANFPRGYNQLNLFFGGGGIFQGGKNILFKYPVQIRGWKYGIFNALPAFSNAVFRTSHYGQNRDMLEQRPYTKFYNETTVFQSPVVVGFISGTTAYSRARDYVSATNPSYNLHDSGIYDYEYKSGFGFVDKEAVD